MRLVLKLAMVFALTLALLIPLLLIQATVQDRKYYRTQAVASVARSHAGAQGLSGPVLLVPYTETVEVEEKNANGDVVRVVKRPGASKHWVFFPNSLTLDGTLTPETRYLGLHAVRVYDLATRTAARFDVRIPTDANPALPNVIGQPVLSYGIRDVRGLAGLPSLQINGRNATLERGLGIGDGNGVHARLPKSGAGERLQLDIAVEFALGGMESLAIAPLGDRNTITIHSPWPHPLFNGDFAPRQRRINAQGFEATWEVSSLASNAQAQYRAGLVLPATADSPRNDWQGDASARSGSEAVGVSLADPVNVYSMADRATKYGILFVALTFVGFFVFEVIKQLRIHPIQYGLVGLALAVFFLLLLALSEHIAFGLAYLAASAACLGLLGYYVGHVLRSRWRGTGFAAMLATLYAALYGLLISEDNAMVLGAGLLFVVLTAVMVVTRRIDWYSVGTPPPPVPATATAA